MKDLNYRLDRAAFAALSFEEADDHITDWINKTEDERLNAACFLINHAFRVDPHNKVDRTITSCRKQT